MSSGSAERSPLRSIPRALEPLLEPLAGIYLSGYALRRLSYAAGFASPRQLPCKVVSVGNITVGGTGKTPFVETLAQIAQSHGKSVAILSRGYKREKATRTPRVVSDGKTVLLEWQAAGDEPYVLASNVPGIPIIVGSDRYEAGTVAVEKFGAELIILDDGFQHWRLARDCDIVLLDARKPLGTLRLLPRGTLREPLGALRRATLFVLTHCNRAPDVAGFATELRTIAGDKPVFLTRHEATEICPVGASEKLSLQHLRGRKAVLVSGIAQPETFEAMVGELGGNISSHMGYGDHHVYTARDVTDIKNAVAKGNAEVVLTTQKDAVKLGNLVSDSLPLYYIRVQIAFENDSERQRFWNVVCASLKYSVSQK